MVLIYTHTDTHIYIYTFYIYIYIYYIERERRERRHIYKTYTDTDRRIYMQIYRMKKCDKICQILSVMYILLAFHNVWCSSDVYSINEIYKICTLMCLHKLDVIELSSCPTRSLLECNISLNLSQKYYYTPLSIYCLNVF